jgi:hypothetical protein
MTFSRYSFVAAFVSLLAASFYFLLLQLAFDYFPFWFGFLVLRTTGLLTYVDPGRPLPLQL